MWKWTFLLDTNRSSKNTWTYIFTDNENLYAKFENYWFLRFITSVRNAKEKFPFVLSWDTVPKVFEYEFLSVMNLCATCEKIDLLNMWFYSETCRVFLLHSAFIRYSQNTWIYIGVGIELLFKIRAKFNCERWSSAVSSSKRGGKQPFY